MSANRFFIGRVGDGKDRFSALLGLLVVVSVFPAFVACGKVEIACRGKIFSSAWGECTFTSDGPAPPACVYVEVVCAEERLRSQKVCSGWFAGSNTVTKPVQFIGKQPSPFKDDNCELQIVDADSPTGSQQLSLPTQAGGGLDQKKAASAKGTTSAAPSSGPDSSATSAVTDWKPAAETWEELLVGSVDITGKVNEGILQPLNQLCCSSDEFKRKACEHDVAERARQIAGEKYFARLPAAGKVSADNWGYSKEEWELLRIDEYDFQSHSFAVNVGVDFLIGRVKERCSDEWGSHWTNPVLSIAPGVKTKTFYVERISVPEEDGPKWKENNSPKNLRAELVFRLLEKSSGTHDVTAVLLGFRIVNTRTREVLASHPPAAADKKYSEDELNSALAKIVERMKPPVATDPAQCPPFTEAPDREQTSKKRKPGRGATKAGIVWKKIPGGQFKMGTEAGETYERPVHEVSIRTFQMARSETTWRQYRACVAAGACSPPHLSDTRCVRWVSQDGKDNVVNELPQEFLDDKQPAVCVDWNQARAFCQWVGGRLPTEGEWEYAARSAGRYAEPWGDSPPDCSRAVFVAEPGKSGCAKGVPWEVCSLPKGATKQGLCDMVGNVWEWVEDQYHTSYKCAPPDGRAWTTVQTEHRVIRGGSWINAKDSRSTARHWAVPDVGMSVWGFRCARDL